MRSLIKKLLILLGTGISTFFSKSRPGRIVLEALLVSNDSKEIQINHKNISLNFVASSELLRWRAVSFSEKEPETLGWIDCFAGDEIFWDIGANIGLYSVYAAKRHQNASVFSFEPSVFCLETLVRNVVLNSVEDRVCIVPIAITERSNFAELKLSTVQKGGALSVFGADYGFDGNEFTSIFSYMTVGAAINDFLAVCPNAFPNHVKIDVDGIEHLILAGATDLLKDRRLISILIEVNDEFSDQAEGCSSLLQASGFSLVAKRSSDFVKNSGGDFTSLFNQIWVRPGSPFHERLVESDV